MRPPWGAVCACPLGGRGAHLYPHVEAVYTAIAQVGAVGGRNALGYPEGLNPSPDGACQAANYANDDADTTATRTATAKSMRRRSVPQCARAVAAVPDRSARCADIVEAEETGSGQWMGCGPRCSHRLRRDGRGCGGGSDQRQRRRGCNTSRRAKSSHGTDNRQLDLPTWPDGRPCA